MRRYADRIMEISDTEGTGDFILLGAMTGYQKFNVAFTNDDKFSYCIEAQNDDGSLTGEWEVGTGHINQTTGRLVRDVVQCSSNQNQKVNFSDGQKAVWLTLSAQDIFNFKSAEDVTDSLDEAVATITALRDSSVSTMNQIKADVTQLKTDTTTLKNQANTSATNAKTSETNAKTSEANAKTSETNAKTSETNALSYKNSASTSASTATAKANEASASATASANSASEAQGYATQLGTAVATVNSFNTRVGNLETNKLDKTSVPASTGSATKPTYVNASGVVSPCTYELKSTVPANAIIPSVLATKTYTGWYATEATAGVSDRYFMSVKPTAWRTYWTLKLRITASVPNQPLYYSEHDIELGGVENVIRRYTINNDIYNTSYRAVYQLVVDFLTSAGFDAGLGHCMGLYLYNVSNYNSADYPRTIKVEVIEQNNCTCTLFNSLTAPGSIPSYSTTNYTASASRSSYDLYNYGLRETGDDTNIYQLRANAGNYTVGSALYRYQLLFQTAETGLMPANAVSNDVGTSKALMTAEFDPFGQIFYYGTTTTINSGSNVGASTLYRQVDFDLRYSFNTGTTLTAHKAVYLKCSAQTNGKFKFATGNPIVQALPTTDDGFHYILLGQAYSTYQIELYPTHPIYYYNNNAIKVWTGATSSAGLKVGVVGQSGNVTTNPWFKFASGNFTATNSDENVIFAVQHTYNVTDAYAGFLRLHIRRNGQATGATATSVVFQWISAGLNIDPSKFVVCYKFTDADSSNLLVELYCKADVSTYGTWGFTLLSELQRDALRTPWTLYKTVSTGLAELPSDMTQVVSTFQSIRIGNVIRMSSNVNSDAQDIIRAYDDETGANNYGFELVIGANGNTYVGAGESMTNLRTALATPTTENLYLSADGSVNIFANCNTIADRKSVVIDTAGTVTATGDVVAYSDERLKDEVETIPDALGKVMAIRGVTFTRNDLPDKDKRHMGVIAQEVMDYIPEVVTENTQILTKEEKEAGVKPKTYYGVSYGNITALLIEAVKEQQSIIKSLEERINILESK